MAFFEVPDTAGDRLVKSLVGLHKVETLAKQIKRSKHVIYRWMNAQSPPKLADILALMYKCSNCLIEFIDALVDASKLPLIAAEVERRRRERQFHYDNPAFASLVRCFELTAYEKAPRHSVPLIAKHSGMDVADVNTLLRQAQEAGLVKQVNGKYQVINKSLSTRGKHRGRLQIVDYWLQRQLAAMQSYAALEDLPEKSHVDYLIFTTNQKTFQKIARLTQDYRHTLLALLHHDDNRAAARDLDRVVLYYSQLADLSVLKGKA